LGAGITLFFQCWNRLFILARSLRSKIAIFQLRTGLGSNKTPYTHTLEEKKNGKNFGLKSRGSLYSLNNYTASQLAYHSTHRTRVGWTLVVV